MSSVTSLLPAMDLTMSREPMLLRIQYASGNAATSMIPVAMPTPFSTLPHDAPSLNRPKYANIATLTPIMP